MIINLLINKIREKLKLKKYITTKDIRNNKK